MTLDSDGLAELGARMARGLAREHAGLATRAEREQHLRELKALQRMLADRYETCVAASLLDNSARAE